MADLTLTIKNIPDDKAKEALLDVQTYATMRTGVVSDLSYSFEFNFDDMQIESFRMILASALAQVIFDNKYKHKP